MVQMTRHRQEGNATDAHELALYAVNDYALYRLRALPIIANLRRKKARGVYDPALALKAWRYMADEAAKSYSRTFGPCYFPPATRDLAAAEIAEYYAEELESTQQAISSPPAAFAPFPLP